MPNCFTLTRKGHDEPSFFIAIDEHLCSSLLMREPHPVHYAYGWYDIIGWALAMGKDWEHMRETTADWLAKDREDMESKDPYIRERGILSHNADVTLIRIINFLERNYDSNAWAEIGGRR